LQSPERAARSVAGAFEEVQSVGERRSDGPYVEPYGHVRGAATNGEVPVVLLQHGLVRTEVFARIGNRIDERIEVVECLIPEGVVCRFDICRFDRTGSPDHESDSRRFGPVLVDSESDLYGKTAGGTGCCATAVDVSI
jgi:hypothetical protein